MNQKTLDTLVEDVYMVLKDEHHVDADDKEIKHLGQSIGKHTARTLSSYDNQRRDHRLWASDLGEPCLRKLWYKFNSADPGVPVDSPTKFKFLFGNVVEDLAIHLMRAAGHSVTYEQYVVETDEYSPWKVRGRIDCVVDGVLVDIKSTSTTGFKKYEKEGLTSENDSFGYLYQLGFYKHYGSYGQDVSSDDPCFLFIDKSRGDWLLLQPEDIPTKEQVDEEIQSILDSVSEGNAGIPAKAYSDKAFGKSGNTQLENACVYCPFRRICWPKAAPYEYAFGTVWLNEITRPPKVPRAKV